ncbi:MAG: SUMF1/EgtB/PvdO family nonheme iron enzyme [Planctomycetes bacterium]|nr:SUMF1/EgtB/PvdO family nonheme iron enzyme [Planctomycetota bacterium]
MQGREADLLYGLLAHRLYFVTEVQLAESVSELRSNPGRDMAGILRERGHVRDAEAQIVHSATIAHLRTHGEAAEALRRIEMPRAVIAAWNGHRNNPSTAETLVMPPRSGLPAPPTAITMVAGPGGGTAQPAGEVKPVVMTQPADRKYVLGEEIGRGGVGRVVEAKDTDIDRTVALKLVLEDAPAEALERFRWEGKITGRLEHPNIVPVHEVGVLPATKEVFVAMKRIVGRDMLAVIHDGTWKLRRLVEAFRDVCRAVAYAHSKGVVHRDLKPANVMLGDFGEVLLVDWGLARLLSEPEKRMKPLARSTTRKVRRVGDAKASKLTMEGQVLGTPSYMPPEQAMGMLDRIDERSDVYSLGAILYEILARCPPFEDPNPWDVVRMVTTEEPKPPSIWQNCPSELEAICLKCLKKSRRERYQTASEVATEIDAYLEGTKERERREKLADEQAGRAEAEIGKWHKLEKESAEAAEKSRAMMEEVKAHDPLAKKKELWELQDRAKALERQALRAFADADAALTSALSNVAHHANARRLKAAMYWEKFLEAEDAGDERAALLHRQVVERHDDGPFTEKLRGDGTIAVRARAYPCRCLEEGRRVKPEELNVHGYHPWSGRMLAMKGSEGMRALEPGEALKLKVHAASCAPEAVAGARVWAFRYVEMDRALIPVTVGAGKPRISESVLNQLFGDSPYRPRGGGQYLGETPIEKRAWAMGSWLLIVAAEGYAAQSVPVFVGRQQDLETSVTLYSPVELPAGFCAVATGAFPYQVRKAGARSAGVTPGVRDIDDFLLGRHSVTCREYLDFLNDMHRTAPDEAARRVPRPSDEGGAYWPLLAKGYVIPTAKWIAAARPEDAARAGRLRSAPCDWEEDWPAVSISWEDAAAYARWAALREGRLIHLPHEEQWEKAGRGPDGREFPWGNHFDAMRCNCSETHSDGLRPVVVDQFPSDESPYGVREMAGNARDWCLNDPGGRRYRDWRVARGGMWHATGGNASPMRRFGFVPTYLEPGQGVRVAAAVRLTDGGKDRG